MKILMVHACYSRYWAVAVPTYCMVIIVLGLAFYIGLNFMATPSPTSLHVIFGKLTCLKTISNCPTVSLHLHREDHI